MDDALLSGIYEAQKFEKKDSAGEQKIMQKRYEVSKKETGAEEIDELWYTGSMYVASLIKHYAQKHFEELAEHTYNSKSIDDGQDGETLFFDQAESAGIKTAFARLLSAYDFSHTGADFAQESGSHSKFS